MPSAPETLTPDQLEALQTLADLFGPELKAHALAQDLCDWAEKNFYIIETQQPIQLLPHQKLILRYMFGPNCHGKPFQTMVYSTVKKSGKTTIAAMIARWIAETWGKFNEVYCMANDLEQARGRIYNGIQKSIELDPRYDRLKRMLPQRWRVIERDLLHLPSSSLVRAVSSDYKGEAGSNPTATFWSELWGYTKEDSKRLWDELTPVPTRPRSIRFVETYAGYENESELLERLYRLGLEGRQLTREEPGFEDWPFDEDNLPIYVHRQARMCMYWDSGQRARRMPWQTPEYYSAQAVELRPLAFDRLHNNFWTSGVSALMPIEWYDACYDPTLPPLGPNEPLVLAADAAVSNDCAALVGVSRHPRDKSRPALRLTRCWKPQKGEPLIYHQTIEPAIRDICSKYNVVQLPYDPYQLHDMMGRFSRDGLVWCKDFSQGQDRTIADKALFDLIKERRLAHGDNDPNSDMRSHFKGAAAKMSKEEDTRFRIIKKSAEAKIDLVVAASMATSECMRLNLG